MTANHSSCGRPIFRRFGIFGASFHRLNHSRKSLIRHSASRWVVVNGGTSDRPEIKEGSQIDDMEDAEDIPANDDDDSLFEEIEHTDDIPADDDDSLFEKIESAEDSPEIDEESPIHRTYQFDNCNVYLHSFNAQDVKVENSGNNAPLVTRMSPFSLAILIHLSMPDP